MCSTFAQQNGDKDKPMRVLPWNQYQLVDEDCEPDLQLASPKHGCGSFVFFRRASKGTDLSTLRLGPTWQLETGIVPHVSINGKDELKANAEDADTRNYSLRSSLRKHSKSILRCESSIESEELFENIPDDACQTARRSIQWTDVCGGELVEVREFEPRCLVCQKDELTDVLKGLPLKCGRPVPS